MLKKLNQPKVGNLISFIMSSIDLRLWIYKGNIFSRPGQSQGLLYKHLKRTWKAHDWFKRYRNFCLVVEFHQGGPLTIGATPSSLERVFRQFVYVVLLLQYNGYQP